MSFMYNTSKNFNIPQPVRAALFSNIKFKKLKSGISPMFRNVLILRLVFSESVNYNAMVFNIWLDVKTDEN